MRKKPELTEEEIQKGIDEFIKNAKDEKNRVNAGDIPKNTTDDINSDETNDTTKDAPADETGSVSSDITGDEKCDTNSDDSSDKESDIGIVLKKKEKYTDKHDRRTYYFLLEHIKILDYLDENYGQDRSYIVNEALKLYFSQLKLSKKAKRDLGLSD